MYRQIINQIDPTVNAAGVEASIRLQYRTLDNLSRRKLAAEVRLALACEAEEPGFLKEAAEGYGLAEAYKAEEARIGSLAA